MSYFSVRLLSHWRWLVGFVAASLAPYVLGLIRDEAASAGLDWAWVHIGGPAVIRQIVGWLATHPVSSVVTAASLWVSLWAVLTHLHLRKIGETPFDTVSPESVLQHVAVHTRGFPRIALREGTSAPRFIVLPSVEIANGSDRAISLSFQLLINITKNITAGYSVLGEPLPQWETIKQFQFVEHIHQALPVPLDLEAHRSRGGYLTFSYTGVRFVDSPTSQIFYVNINDLDRPIRDMKLQLRELHSNVRREFDVGCIDVRQLLEPLSSTAHTEAPPTEPSA